MTVIDHEVTETRPVTRRDVLHRAADLLEEFGWCQNNLYEADADGNDVAYCMGGAVWRAHHDLTGKYANVSFHHGDGGNFDLPTFVGIRYPGVWNDESRRTKAEVVARLREAADA